MMGRPSARAFPLVAAFAVIYLVWGSTYLAIKVLVGIVPPLLVAGLRATTAGVILLLYAMARGITRPTAVDWANGTVAGGLMFLVGHGALFWGSQYIASGYAAVLVATIPVWVASFTLFSTGALSRQTTAGLALATTGIVWLHLPAMHAAVDPRVSAVLLGGAVSWALAMVWYRGSRRPASTIMASALPLLTGGILLITASVLLEHPSGLTREALSFRAVACFGYVVLFGSVLGFSAFAWLNGVVSPTAVSSYAFVNPIVALALGWSIGHEAFTPATLLPTSLVIGAVGLVLTGERQRRRSPEPLPQPAPAR